MAAVARPSTTNSPHLGGSKSMTSSPRSNRTSLHNLDSLRKDEGSEVKSDVSSLPTIKHPEETDAAAKTSKDSAAPTNAPLAPPPKPTQNGDGDYFGNQNHLSKEPNPFENAFSNPADTPGKTQLPGVTSLTSPASLLPGNTPGWPGSLRSGPLSPAMLTGPTGSNDYFNSDHHFAGSFPTPNESSLRTGLTPGGGGSMFPQPSPNSQAIYNQLQSGGATPGTLDFHRTAMTARAQSQTNSYGMASGVATTQAQANPNIQPDLDSKAFNATSNAAPDNHDPFGSHQTNDAANGLFMLAQAGGQQRNSQAYPMGQQQGAQGYQAKAGAKGSIGSTMSGSTDAGDGQYSEEDSKVPARGARGKKNNSNSNGSNNNNNNNAASKATTNGKRKPEEAQAKGQAYKKQRGSNGHAVSEEPEDDDDDDDMDDDNKRDGLTGFAPDNRKMTDEEKRKNFLERNRVAALKCRQRKKQWLANLQQKVEMFSTENDALAATVTQLREEIVGLKTLLLAHKDCPVSQAQGISGMAMQQIAGDTQHYANPYGMGMGQQPQMAQGQMQRR